MRAVSSLVARGARAELREAGRLVGVAERGSVLADKVDRWRRLPDTIDACSVSLSSRRKRRPRA
jgi:hypothetical protein